MKKSFITSGPGPLGSMSLFLVILNIECRLKICYEA